MVCSKNGYCLACTLDSLKQSNANTRCTDFICSNCNHSYELKTFLRRPFVRLPDDAYAAMMSRIYEGTTPFSFALRTKRKLAHTVTHSNSFNFSNAHCYRKKKTVKQQRRSGWLDGVQHSPGQNWRGWTDSCDTGRGRRSGAGMRFLPGGQGWTAHGILILQTISHLCEMWSTRYG
jgi:hypothetical protein